MLRCARDSTEQNSLILKIRREGLFKALEQQKTLDDIKKPKFNLICIRNSMDPKNRVIVSEKAQLKHTWSTTILENAPTEIQKKVKSIATEQPKHT